MSNKTLLELLVEELPGRGGWPNGFEYCCQNYTCILFTKDIPTLSHAHAVWYSPGVTCTIRDKLLRIATDHYSAIVTRAQYEAALAAKNNPSVVEWNGKGLPPEGTVCEIKQINDWFTVKINHISSSRRFVICTTNDGEELVFQAAAVWFRPLRTPEQIEAERRKSIANELYKTYRDSLGCTAEAFFAIYDAIRAGEIDGVKLDDQ